MQNDNPPLDKVELAELATFLESAVFEPLVTVWYGRRESGRSTITGLLREIESQANKTKHY